MVTVVITATYDLMVNEISQKVAASSIENKIPPIGDPKAAATPVAVPIVTNYFL